MDDVVARIKEQISSSPVLLYMKGIPEFPQCGFSAQVVHILHECGVPFDHVNILDEPEIREALKAFSNWPTFPQLYVNRSLVGGCDIVTDMFQKGELQTLLKDAG